MADPRFLQTAFRIGHVYSSPSVQLQGNDFPQDPSKPSLVEEFRSTMLGPMDPRDFLDAFFSKWAKIYGSIKREATPRIYSKVPPTAAYRQFIVDPLVQILNYEPPHGCRASGNIVFCDRARLSKLQRRHMPDIVAINEHFQLVVDKSKASCEPLEIDSMALVEYFITVQPDREDDFFHDPRPEMKHLFDPNKPSLHTHFFALSHIHDPEEKAKATRGLEQMITRVQDMWDQQHRTHIFTISMAGSMARFLLWDRSGAIVTRAFDIRQQPDLLDDFQSMYYRSSREVRGYDTTVSWAGSVKSTSKDEPKGLGKGQRTEPEEGS